MKEGDDEEGHATVLGDTSTKRVACLLLLYFLGPSDGRRRVQRLVPAPPSFCSDYEQAVTDVPQYGGPPPSESINAANAATTLLRASGEPHAQR